MFEYVDNRQQKIPTQYVPKGAPEGSRQEIIASKCEFEQFQTSVSIRLRKNHSKYFPPPLTRKVPEKENSVSYLTNYIKSEHDKNLIHKMRAKRKRMRHEMNHHKQQLKAISFVKLLHLLARDNLELNFHRIFSSVHLTRVRLTFECEAFISCSIVHITNTNFSSLQSSRLM